MPAAGKIRPGGPQRVTVAQAQLAGVQPHRASRQVNRGEAASGRQRALAGYVRVDTGPDDGNPAECADHYWYALNHAWPRPPLPPGLPVLKMPPAPPAPPPPGGLPDA